MAKTQDLKRRIRSIRNTMQLTRAMKMVAASKLRRAQERMLKSRPYTSRTLSVLQSLAVRTSAEDHPLLRVHERRRGDVIAITADKGLCGAFNAGVIRTAETFMREQRERHGLDLRMSVVGKKGREYFGRRYDLLRTWTDVFRQDHSAARQIAGSLIERFVEREADVIFLVYNEFKSAIQCRPLVQTLLPIEPAALKAGRTLQDYLYEPSAAEIFDALLPHYVENQVFQALLESTAAEHAARMTAMESATKNAGELIEGLTLTMNRVRQASITTEIIEVVSGAEALG